MTGKVSELIRLHFPEDQQQRVADALFSLEPEHVMARSDTNLENTRLAILKLSQGNLQQVIYFTEKAKVDFRDVILWAGQH